MPAIPSLFNSSIHFPPSVRWFSKSKPSSQAASGEKFRKVEFAAFRAGDGMQIVQPRDVAGAAQLVPSFAVDFLMSCDRFAPLGEHVRRYAQMHDSDELEMQSLASWFPQAREAGLFISEGELRAEIVSGSSGGEVEPGKIELIGFPTGNRPEMAQRALESFAANARDSRRDIEFVLADNSRDSTPSREMAARVSRQAGMRVTFLGEGEKRELARELTRLAGCDPAVLEFALFDPEGCQFLCGANRNALLLHGAGRMLSSVDDDMICRLSAPPDSAPAAVQFFAHQDVFERWFYSTREAARDDATVIQADYLEQHEALLGREVAQCMGADRAAQFGKISDEVLRRLRRGGGRVVATFTGYIGDPGVPTSYYYLGYRRASFRRLTQSEESYRQTLGSRNVRVLAPQPSIGDASLSPGLAMGLDGRDLLPPFMPILHAEDFIYGATLWRCCPHGFLAHLPCALDHEPANVKPILQPGDLREHPGTTILEFAHLLRLLVLEYQPSPNEETTAQRIVAMGRHLRGIAEAPPADCAEYLRTRIAAHESGKIAYLEARLRRRSDPPDFWARDVEEYLEHTRQAFTHPEFDIPFDLQTRGPADEVRLLMRRLIGRFGALLEAWPAVFAAAKERTCRTFT